ncbi:MAG: hypothetical protein IJF65_03060 [Clostridia bacterium]|nr:hypothetical protein [Clostridia bacterium]
MIRRFILLTLLFLALAAPALALEMEVVNVNEWVSLRKTDSAKSAQLAKIPLGAVVQDCQYVDSEWVSCRYGGQQGYVLAKYLSPVTAPAQEAITLGDMQVVNCEDWVSLRASPDAQSKRLVKVPLGDTVTGCVSQGNGFIQCTYKGKTGYIKEEYLTLAQTRPMIQNDWLSQCRQRIEAEGCLAGVMLISNAVDAPGLLANDPATLAQLKALCAAQWQSLLNDISVAHLTEIPQGQQLYLIIPADERASVTAGPWPGEAVYTNWQGAPFMVRCTASGFNPDCQVTITDSQGNTLTWYPFLDQSTGRVRTQGMGGSVCDLSADQQALPQVQEVHEPLVTLRYTKDALGSYEAWDVFFADNNPQLSYVLFSCEDPVANFKLLALDWQGETFTPREIYHADWLQPNRPLAAGMTLTDALPAYGLSYEDEKGTLRQYAISPTGFKGALELKAFK